ncbi:MAG: type II toxin-antitoxin system HicB family antitoxin [Acidobacteria bacterium]|nr:type II toxin-antitoxin system HicB family antitoxin [Acidobacteriota bacterium]MBV9436712.1 type II toxin-antitoxin system HicB family antitoxin [Acidobacteriota bacterium]
MKYSVVLQKSEEGYAVSCPGLPGCWSEGATEEDALQNVKLAIAEYVKAAWELVPDGERHEVEVP